MENWIILAIISAILTGLANFWIKVSVERWYNVNSYALYANFLSFVLFSLILLFQWKLIWTLQNSSIFILLLAFINISLLTLSVPSRAKSLENIDTVIFYPIYKTIGPILVTFVSYFLIKETLALKEFLWVIVWIFVPLLLITRTENRIQKNLMLWLVFIWVTVFMTSIAQVMPKIIQIQGLDIDTFLLLAFLVGSIFSYGVLQVHEKKSETKKKKAPIFFWILLWLFHFGSMYCYTHALTGNLAIVFTINSFSILIPIILSILFYKEHFSFKKWIVIALSIISVLLFI